MEVGVCDPRLRVRFFISGGDELVSSSAKKEWTIFVND